MNEEWSVNVLGKIVISARLCFFYSSFKEIPAICLGNYCIMKLNERKEKCSKENGIQYIY